MTNPTRQEMLDSITHKIAQIVKWQWTWHNDCLTCWEQCIFTTHTCIVKKPVMIGDVLDWMENTFLPKVYKEQTWFGYPIDNPIYPARHIEIFYKLWKTKREPLSAQDDDCISYIFNLVSNAK